MVDGTRQEAAPNQKGVCCFCGSPTSSRCGDHNAWHWAHDSLKLCNYWWEKETDWHKLWKSYFPIKNQEIIHFDKVTGEKHIADIKTDNAMVIEVQNSPMTEKELALRENFYGKMFWVVNGNEFKHNFYILSKLPNPSCDFFKDISFFKQVVTKYKNKKKIYYPPLHFFKKPYLYNDFNEMQPAYRIQNQIDENYVGHHLFDWKNPRYVWFKSEKPVFIDFGEDILWWLKKYDDTNLMCVQKICKQKLIRKNGGEYM
ncbi:hypothetical protein N0Y54_03390 [Nostoc punctiforme UO1]|uniref:hypothetical protein n=1 Tax=Nostoc punctiforme TaxID=272131 RepID=UPI0030A9BDD8